MSFDKQPRHLQEDHRIFLPDTAMCPVGIAVKSVGPTQGDLRGAPRTLHSVVDPPNSQLSLLQTLLILINDSGSEQL
jgi:hypothetical protein